MYNYAHTGSALGQLLHISCMHTTKHLRWFTSIKINGNYLFHKILTPFSDEEYSANAALDIMMDTPFGCVATMYYGMSTRYPRLHNVPRSILCSQEFRDFMLFNNVFKSMKQSYAQCLGETSTFDRFQYRVNIRCNNKVCGKFYYYHKYGRNMTFVDHSMQRGKCKVWMKREDRIGILMEKLRDGKYYDSDKKKQYKNGINAKDVRLFFIVVGNVKNMIG